MGKNLIVASNPAPKKRKRTTRTAAQRRASKRNIKKAQAARRRRKTPRRRNTVAKRRTYRRRSNPPKFSFKGIVDRQVMPALVGGGGAVLNDLLVNFVPFIPANFRTGWLRHVTKAVGAIAISYVGGMFLTKRTADQLGAGAMTVVGYNLVRDLATQFAPAIPLGEYLSPVGEYLDPSLGYYGAGLDPSTVPGSGMETAGQFTRGSPYMGGGDHLDAWPTGSAYDDIQD